MNQRLSSRTPGVRRFCSVILHFCPQNHSQQDDDPSTGNRAWSVRLEANVPGNSYADAYRVKFTV